MNPTRRHRVCQYVLLPLVCVVTASVMFAYFNPGTAKRRSEEKSRFYVANPARELEADELPPDVRAVSVPEIEQAETLITAEAEYVEEKPPDAQVEDSRWGYSGIGYLTGLPDATESALEIPVQIPATQHYAVTICVGANDEVTNALRINGELLSPFTMRQTKTFVRVTFYGIFLNKGDAVLAIDTIDNGIDVDYIEITNDSSVYGTEFEIADAPCDPNAAENTKALYGFLKEQWGSGILTGQYASSAENFELRLIDNMTGQLPAIRFGELGTADDNAQIDAAADWYLREGGIVGLMWHWNAPGYDSVYADEADFDLAAALENADIPTLAMMSADEAREAVRAGECPADALELLLGIDDVAQSLRKLANMDIPVLWRPLHEAGGGWFWWGAAGEGPYIKLWNLLFERLTDYHGLHNLIWLWNGQSSAYLVPEQTYDIATMDIYLRPEMEYGSRYEQFRTLSDITGRKKMLGISECGSLPDLERMRLDNAGWLFCGLWYGEYLMTPTGGFDDTYFSSDTLYDFYNSDFALTLYDYREMTAGS